MNKKLNIFSVVLAGAVGASLGFGELKETEASSSAKVNTTSLTVRSGAGVNYKAIDYLQKNEVVTIIADYGAFSKISFDKNKTGYVSDKYLTAIKNSTTSTTTSSYVVNTAQLNVRAAGNASAKILTTVKKNTPVTVLSSYGTWWKIKVGNVTGFVNGSYLSKGAVVNQTPKPTSTIPTYYVNTASLNVRAGGSATHKIVTTLKKGSSVSVLASSGTWWKIKTGNTTGYVNSTYLSKTAVSTQTVKPNTTSATYYVNTGSLNVRAGGSATHKILTTAKQGTAVSVLTTSGTWWKIKVGNTTGYVNKNYLSSKVVSSSNNNPSTTVASTSKLKGKVIVIDPGHGGKFAGAQKIVHEEDVNLQIALKTRDYLQKQGAKVIMTRTNDTHLHNVYDSDLVARANVANHHNASMFISIHANAGGGTGTEVYFHNSSRGDKKLAQEIVTEIASSTGLNNRGAKQFSYAVIRSTKNSIPSVLVETGFTDTKFDASIIGSASGQNKIANAITEGVLDYYGK